MWYGKFKQKIPSLVKPELISIFYVRRATTHVYHEVFHRNHTAVHNDRETEPK